jgi:VIT1/CCC1 family predicted Fe2+/Mn2+ transporter
MLPAETTQVAMERPLDPVERISESLFGLIMVLTFTCSISAADPGREEVRTMLFGALGCNLAWGVIDAIMYLMACLAERGNDLVTLRAVRRAANALEGQRILADALPSPIAAALKPDQLESVRQHLTQLPEPPAQPRLGSREWLGALAVFCWVFLVTFPVALPFVFLHERQRALRVSNLIAVALLFVMGRAYAKAAGLHPWWTAVVMVLLGGAMVAATIALGG